MRRRGRSASELNVWPAFVDVLATLLLVIILLVMAVTLTQFYTANQANQERRIGDQLSDRLQTQRDQIDGLVAERLSLLANLEGLSNELSILTTDRDTAQEAAESLLAKLAEVEGEAVDLQGTLTDTLLQMDDKLVRLLSVLSEAEAARENLSAQNQNLVERNTNLTASLADLGERINDSLLLQAEELQRQRSLFFGSLIDVLGERDDISVVGDRFVFQSEVLFASGSAELGSGGQTQLARLAETILNLANDFPDDLDWILRIDGHTDARPIGENSRSGFENNWQLSSERARSVVEFLVDQGVPPERLTAAGFGSYQPLVDGNNEDAFARNRRIEVKLTTR